MGDPKSKAGKPTDKVRLLGQVATPAKVARDMATNLLRGRASEPLHILDPCVGPYTFPVALGDSGRLMPGDVITVVDVDPDMTRKEGSWSHWQDVGLQRITGDYLQLPMDETYDLAILNPPYVRQEWIDKKREYRSLFRRDYGINVPGMSNLYVYFLVKVMADLKIGGRFACIIYDSWQATQFGQWLIGLVGSCCSEIEINGLSGRPFVDRLLDATVIYGSKQARLKSGRSSGRTGQTSVVRGPFSDVEGFVQLDSIFSTYRGLRLKQAGFFLCSLNDCAALGATPFLKKVGKLKGLFRVPDHHDEAALLIAPEESKPAVMLEIEKRIQLALKEPSRNESIITWFKERPETWFSHDRAPYAPIVFNYYIRHQPKHIYNPDRVFSDNFYGLSPRCGVSIKAWLAALNSTAVRAEIMAHSRNQGSGLAKIQLFEYRRIQIPNLATCSDAQQRAFHALGDTLITMGEEPENTLRRIDDLIMKVFCHPKLEPARVSEIYEEADYKARRPKG